jgi:hypothetical protein
VKTHVMSPETRVVPNNTLLPVPHQPTTAALHHTALTLSLQVTIHPAGYFTSKSTDFHHTATDFPVLLSPNNLYHWIIAPNNVYEIIRKFDGDGPS